MRRSLFEIWEQIYYLFHFRWEYIRIKKRYWFHKRGDAGGLRNISAWILVLAILAIAVLIGYRFPSIGFSDYISPSGGFQRGKTLWDWMQLLVVPLILAILAYYLTSSQRDKEIAVARIEKSADALQNYLDYMTKLLVEQDYADEEKFEGAARLMRARTLTVLGLLNGEQKGHLLRFLIEAGLLDKNKPYLNMKRADLTKIELDPGGYSDLNLDGVNLDNANLAYCHFQNIQMNSISMRNAYLEGMSLTSASLDYIFLSKSDLYDADLSNASLHKADLSDTNFENAYLREAVLSRANLRGSNLRKCIATKIYLYSSDLSFANLEGADLEEANLSNANLYGANLRNANLKNADLTDSNITARQLRKAKSFHGAKLPSTIRMDKLE